ncbi:putative membrane protein [Desulfobaculum xiamenense]|uniref:Putative membrane protein n=1 Tax=Desulfobaculum xiamenense TaxID=995050 RepID=A0A846QN42_9BACT|nr:AzlD domain-containing protein [Desulfobaculum xiamenense]NJB66654.1 putative membrane protein [Desulfobaculum xiamenense]
MQLTESMMFGAIALCALVTYSLRAGGLLLAERLPQSGRIRKAMDALPGTIMVSLVAPSVFAAGAGGMAGAALTVLVAWRTGNVFVAMLAGMAVVAVERNFLV